MGEDSPGVGRLFYAQEDDQNAGEDSPGKGRYATVKISSFASLPQTPRNSKGREVGGGKIEWVGRYPTHLQSKAKEVQGKKMVSGLGRP